AIAVFGNMITGATTVNMSAGAMVGELRFEDVNANSLTAAYTIGSSSQTITFNNGASASLLDVTGFTSTNQTVAAKISAAGGQPLNIVNNGAPGLTTLTLSGAFSATTAGTALNVDGA